MKLVYNDKSFCFEEFPERDKTVTIHEKNIQAVLLTEIFKIKAGLHQEYWQEFSTPKTIHKIRERNSE